MRYKILMTARDPAAALHLGVVFGRLQADAVLDVVFYAQQPAFGFLRQNNIPARLVDLPPARHADDAAGESLLTAAGSIVADERPDAVLCGLSTPFDGGLDEAVAARFEGPVFLLQDFWGEQNRFFGGKADLIFGLDDEAVKLTHERHATPCMAVGSARHAAYADLPIHDLRMQQRQRIGAEAGTVVFGYFGQGLHHLAGYRDTLETWIEAVVSLKMRKLVLYKPHPRESAENRDWTVSLLGKIGCEHIVCDTPVVEHAILACDSINSAFSNCTYDAAYLNYYAGRPILSPVSLFYNAEIREYFQRIVELEAFPYLKTGLVKLLDDDRDLADQLAESVSPECKQLLYDNSRKLRDPIGAPAKIQDIMVSFLNGDTSLVGVGC